METRAGKRLRRLPADVQRDLAQAIRSLAADPRPRGCRKIRGKTDCWRMAVRGDYRVLYRVREHAKQVVVHDAG